MLSPERSKTPAVQAPASDAQRTCLQAGRAAPPTARTRPPRTDHKARIGAAARLGCAACREWWRSSATEPGNGGSGI